MPLIKGKSKKSFEKNIKTEIESGKPLKQSLAIAYDVQRKAKKKAKKENPAENASTPAFREYAENKMAEGGGVLRLIKTHTSSDGKRTAKVYRDPEFNEYRVKHFVDGKHSKNADYHTDEASDAHDTANHWLKMNEESAEGEKKMAYGGYAEGGHVCSKCGHSEDAEASDLESGSTAQKIIARKKFAKGGAVEDDMVDLEANNMEGPGMDRSYNIKAKKFYNGDIDQLSPQPRDSNLKGRKLEESVAARVLRKLKKGI